MTPAVALDPAVTDPYEGAMVDVDPAQDDPTAQYRQMYGEKYEKLPLQIINALREQLKKLAFQDKFMRRVEVLRDRRNRFYEKGIQHIVETNGGSFAQFTPGAFIPTANGAGVQCGMFVDDYDIYGPYTRIQQSVLTQNPPGIAFEPDDPTKAECEAAANAAEKYWIQFGRVNDIKARQTTITRMFQLSGRAVAWTRTEQDAQKFGLNPDGSPKRMEVVSIYGTLEHKCPILAKDLSGCLFNILYDDPNVLEMKALYGGIEDWEGKTLRSKISANTKGLGEDEYERMARMGVLQGTRALTQIGESIAHIATRANCWLRPAAFSDEAWDDVVEVAPEQGSVRDMLSKLYPEGIHAVFVGDTYCGSWNESTDDALEIQLPYDGDGMFGRAIMDPLIVVQDAVNDDLNAFREVANYGWPSTWINADETQYKAIGKQVSSPYAYRQFELRGNTGDDIRKAIFREQDPVIPPTLYELMNFLQGPFAQFLLATPPSLWGEAMSDQKTASGYHLAASQAMGQMGLWFGRIQRMFARIAYQAALCAARNPDHAQGFAIPDEGGTTAIQLSSISKERFKTFPDEDSSFPESTMQKRATLDSILDFAVQAPEVGMALLAVPQNWKTVLRYKGFSEIVIPQAEAADACQFKIEQLLQQSGVRSQQAIMAASVDPMTGQPIPVDPMSIEPDQPSIMPDPLDYHQWEFDYGQQWVNSQACRDQMAQGNEAGVQNVKLYVMAQQAMIPPPPMLPGPVGTAGGPPQDKPPLPAAPAAPEAPLAAPMV